MTQTILFIHGYMNNGAVWEKWKTYFENRGYTCLSPSWPYAEGTVEQIRRNPPEQLKDVSFDDVVDHYAHIIAGMPEQPILVGHSLGGVVVQKLVNLGYGAAAVCLTSGPPRGIAAFNLDFIVSNLLLTHPLRRDPLILMSDRWYHTYVTNDLTLAQTEQFTAQNCVPASRKVSRTIGSIDFDAPHVPLLFIAGENDRSQPPVITRKIYEAYTDPASVKDYKLFEGRTHHILGQDGWEEVADYIVTWLQHQNI